MWYGLRFLNNQTYGRGHALVISECSLSNLLLYLDATKKTVDYLTDAVEVFVGKELGMFENQRTIPFVVFITLVSACMQRWDIGCVNATSSRNQGPSFNLRASVDCLSFQTIVDMVFFQILFVPFVVYLTLHVTWTMLKYTEIYNERVITYKMEKKRTELLLTALLPKSMIHQGRTIH